MIGKLKNLTSGDLISRLPQAFNNNNKIITAEFDNIFDSKKNILTKSLVNEEGIVKTHTGQFINLIAENLSFTSLESLLELLARLAARDGDNLVIKVYDALDVEDDRDTDNTISVSERYETSDGNYARRITLSDDLKEKLSTGREELDDVMEKSDGLLANHYKYINDANKGIHKLEDDNLSGTIRIINFKEPQLDKTKDDYLKPGEFIITLTDNFVDKVNNLYNLENKHRERLERIEYDLYNIKPGEEIPGKDVLDKINKWHELLDFFQDIMDDDTIMSVIKDEQVLWNKLEYRKYD